MTVTEEELQRIVARAVRLALDEILCKEQTPQTGTNLTKPVEVKPFEEDELANAMRFMASNRKINEKEYEQTSHRQD